MKVAASSLAPILRSDTQGRIFARLFSDPDAEHTLTGLADWAATSSPPPNGKSTERSRRGVVTVRRVGPARLVQVNQQNPFFGALRRLILGTYGPPIIVAQEFAAVEDALAVVLFGSWVARYCGVPGRVPNDVDVLIIGDVDRDSVDDAAERAEELIGLPVQATVRTAAQWRAAREAFIKEVRQRPLVPVLVDDRFPELAAELADLAHHGDASR